jgi:hypothetical protein
MIRKYPLKPTEKKGRFSLIRTYGEKKKIDHR